MFAGYDEDDSDALEFAELQTLCQFTAQQLKKKRKNLGVTEYVEQLKSLLDPHNEGVVPRDRFLSVTTEQMPELVSLLIPESLLEVSEWTSVFRNVEQHKLSTITAELFQLVQSGNVENKKIKDILNKET